jgi:hypothetical protein
METKGRKAYNEAPVRPLAQARDRRLPDATLPDLVLKRLEAETQPREGLDTAHLWPVASMVWAPPPCIRDTESSELSPFH